MKIRMLLCHTYVACTRTWYLERISGVPMLSKLSFRGTYVVGPCCRSQDHVSAVCLWEIYSSTCTCAPFLNWLCHVFRSATRPYYYYHQPRYVIPYNTVPVPIPYPTSPQTILPATKICHTIQHSTCTFTMPYLINTGRQCTNRGGQSTLAFPSLLSSQMHLFVSIPPIKFALIFCLSSLLILLRGTALSTRFSSGLSTGDS